MPKQRSVGRAKHPRQSNPIGFPLMVFLVGATKILEGAGGVLIVWMLAMIGDVA